MQFANETAINFLSIFFELRIDSLVLQWPKNIENKIKYYILCDHRTLRSRML
jgi:hypothetical protein